MTRTGIAGVLRGRHATTIRVYIVLLGVIAVAAIIANIAGRNLLTPGNMRVLMTSIAVLGLVAIGQTLVVMVGSLDLSVGYLVSLSSVLAAGVMSGTAGQTFAGIAVALIATTLIGTLTGLLVGVLKLSGFIGSLGVGLLVAGYLATNYRGTTGKATPAFSAFGVAEIGPFPASTLLMLLVLVLAFIMVSRTRIGMHMLAVGGDPEVARTSGIRPATPIITAHAISGLCAGLAGLVIVARLGVGSPTAGAQGGYDLLSIAAVVLGGTTLAGGRGTLWGTLGGILIFAVVDAAMGILEINPFFKDVVRGIVIVAAVALYARRMSSPQRKRFGPDGTVARTEGAVA